MNIEEIKTLTDLMVENDLAEVMIRDGEKRIIIRRGTALKSAAPVYVPTAPVGVPMANPSPAGFASPAAPAADDPTLALVKSPMVGTFYLAASPGAKPFVNIGDRVKKETTVCIITAMKVNNEIHAGVEGVIESIEVKDNTAVDVGKVLMKVRTS